MKKILLLIFIFLCAFSVPTQQYTLTDDDVVVTDGVIMSCSYSFELTDIIIPETLDGQTVTEIWGDPGISNSVFREKGITSVQFPETLLKIGRYTFSRNSLSEVVIPNSVTEMDTGAFRSNQLTSVTLSDNLKVLENQVFMSNKLTSISIPDNVYKISEGAFGSNSGLTSITLPTVSDPGFINWIDNEGNTYPNGTIVTNVDSFFIAQLAHTLTNDDVVVVDGIITSCTLNNSATSITIPEVLDRQTIIGLGYSLFSGDALTAVDLPETITSIGNYAFYNCNLTSITLPSGLSSIGDLAFSSNSLTEVLLPESLTSLGSYAFAYNNLTEVKIPGSVTVVEDYAFRSNYDLAKVTINEGTTSIGDYAFYFCYDLTDLSIANSVTYIGVGAFDGYTALASFILPTPTKTGYTASWIDSNSVEYATGAEVTDKTVSYTANFEINTYVISGTVSGADGVSLTLSGDVEETQTVTTSGDTFSFSVEYNRSVVLTASKLGYLFDTEEYSFPNIYGDKTETNFVASINEELNTYVPDDNFEQALIDLGYDDVLNDYVLTDNINTITSLNVSSKSIADLTGIEDFVALTNLNCYSNALTSLDLSGNTALTALYCESNQLTSIDVSQNTALTSLECYSNKLTSLDLSVNTALTTFWCHDNELTRLNIANRNNSNFSYFKAYNNPNLTCIQVDDADWSTTNWTDIDTQSYFNEESCYTYVPDDNFEQALIELGYDTDLDDYVLTENINTISYLYVVNENISDLTGIEDFVSLEELHCRNNNLSALDISNNVLLTYLTCRDNNLTVLDVSKNIVLEKLTCSTNSIEDLDVSQNTKLHWLYSQANNLEKLNVANGNNSSFTDFNATNNPDLTCIQVDDAEWSTTNWTSIDDTASFSENCPRTLTWTGVTSSDWSTGSNWNLNTTPPIATDNVIINNVATAPILNHSVTINNLTIDTSASLNINAGKSLTINNDISNNGSLIINSDENNSGSFIVKGIATGEKITYNRFVTDQWHLIASPLNEQGIASFVTDANPNNQIAISSKGNYGLATYNNNGTAWNYYTSATLSGNFETGKGYTLKRNINGIVSFKGYLKTEDTEVNIAQAANNWNLIGNPYPSYISVNDFLDENGSIGSSSLSDLNEAIYLWDATENSGLGGYVPKNYSDSYKISPGQGFFVNAGSNTTVKFKESMQSSETTLFARSQNDGFQIKLQITDGEKVKSTRIKYLKAATKNFDTGYDAGIFTGESTNFNIYTSLIDNSTNSKLALQCLPINDLENTIVPIGLNSSKKEITFSINLENSPSSIKVFLEDRLLNTFKRLDEVNSFYKITLTDDVSRTGRFYIHTTQSSLYIDDNQTFNPINVYEFGNSTLKITGLENNKLELKIFSTLGQQIIDTSFKPNDIKEISLPQINTGIYIVQMITESGILSKKIKLN